MLYDNPLDLSKLDVIEVWELFGYFF